MLGFYIIILPGAGILEASSQLSLSRSVQPAKSDDDAATLLRFKSTSTTTWPTLRGWSRDDLHKSPDAVCAWTGVVCDNPPVGLGSKRRVVALNLTLATRDAVFVSGNLRELAACTALRYLDLSHTSVHGDIATLNNCTQLQALNLQHTHVYGSIEALAQNTKLSRVRLRYTDIGGDTTGTCDQCNVFEVDECSRYQCSYKAPLKLEPIAAMAGATDYWCCSLPCNTAQDYTRHMKAVRKVCCDEPFEDCSLGYPKSCNWGCAHVIMQTKTLCFVGYLKQIPEMGSVIKEGAKSCPIRPQGRVPITSGGLPAKLSAMDVGGGAHAMCMPSVTSCPQFQPKRPRVVKSGCQAGGKPGQTCALTCEAGYRAVKKPVLGVCVL
eukprot:COSAG01_NODE_12240_length_1775_cov_3.566702_2_plen_379_part_01